MIVRKRVVRMTEQSRLEGWRAALTLYGDRRMLVILLMGFSSGLPLLLGFSTLSYWLKGEGVSLTTIGWLLSVSTPYSLKFLWAPVLDHAPLPFLTRHFGQRRGWLFLIQPLLLIAILAVGLSDPKEGLVYLATATLLVAFLSASQDVVIDAYRIEILEDNDEEQGAGSSATQVGYRIGLLVAGAGAIALSDFVSWFWVYAIMAAFMLVGLITTIFAKEPRRFVAEPWPDQRPQAFGKRLTANIQEKAIEPIREFLRRNRAAAIWVILFVLFYKYGDAVAGAMSYPFYYDMGFTGVEIASVTKVFGIAMAAAGAVVGGIVIIQIGLIWSLLIGGILQAITNLLFAYLASLGNDLTWLTIAIGADNFTGGLGSAAFVAFLSRLCNVAFTATQFALFTSLMALSRVVFATPSGWLADKIGWVDFFVSTTAFAIPALLLLFMVSRHYESVMPKSSS